MDSPSRIPVMPTSNVRSRVLKNQTPLVMASPSRIPVLPTSNIRSRVLSNRPPPAMIRQARKLEGRHSRRSTSLSSLGQSLSKNISKILPKNRKEKGGTLRIIEDVEDPFFDDDELHIVAKRTQLKKKRAVIADLVDLFDAVAKKPVKSARRVPSFTGGLGLSWINRRNSFEWERVDDGTTGESQLKPKKAGTFKKLWGNLKHRTVNTNVDLNVESREDKDVDDARVSITPSEIITKKHVAFIPNSEVNNAESDIISIAPTESIAAEKTSIVVAPTEHIASKKSDIVVALSEHIAAQKSDIAVAQTEIIATEKSNIVVAPTEHITAESDIVDAPTEIITTESDIVVALTENTPEKNEKRARHEERRSFRQSDDYLGVQGANPHTGLIDWSPVISSTEVSEEDTQGTHERSSRLSEATKATLVAVHEARRQAKLEARLRQEQINRVRRAKLDARNFIFRQKAEESGRWRSSDGYWSYQPALSPVKERNNFVNNQQLQQSIVDDQQPQKNIIDNRQPQLSIVIGQQLQQNIEDDQKSLQSIVDDQKPQKNIVDNQKPQKKSVANRQTADETVNVNFEKTSFLRLLTRPESPKCATTIICTSTTGLYIQELPVTNPVGGDREDIADHFVRLNHLVKEGKEDIADHSVDLTIGIMEDIETIHGLMEHISIEGVEAVEVESMIKDLDAIQDTMKEIGVIHPPVINVEVFQVSVMDEKVNLEGMEASVIDEESIMKTVEEIETKDIAEVKFVEDILLEYIFVQDIIVEDNAVEEIILENADVKDVDVENVDVGLTELEDVDVEHILNAFDIVDGVMGNVKIETTAPATTSLVEGRRDDFADHFSDLEIIEMKDLVRGWLIGSMVIAAAAVGAFVLKGH